MPKPRGYPKIILPQREYTWFEDSLCPFRFSYPTYAVINRDTAFLDTLPENPCWFNLTFPSLNGNLHISYKEIDDRQPLSKLVEEAHRLSYKHVIKAEFIEERMVNNGHSVSGLMYDIGGNTASGFQFFLTDSHRHFLRASLYFYNTPNADSIAPVLEFVRDDLLHLIESFRWKP